MATREATRIHLWWKESLLKHRKVSKYYETDCRWNKLSVFNNCGVICFLTNINHQRCSIKKGVLRNFTKFTGKHLKFLRTPFLQNISGRLLLSFSENSGIKETMNRLIFAIIIRCYRLRLWVGCFISFKITHVFF